MSYIVSSQNVRIEQQSASLAARAVAQIIDWAFLGAYYYFLAANRIPRHFSDSVQMLMVFLPMLLPLVLQTLLGGQTIGKRIMRIRVVSIDGGGPKLMSLVIRWLLAPVDVVFGGGMGELCVFFTPRQQRLGDLAAGTWVVRTETLRASDFNISDYESENYTPQYPLACNLTAQQAATLQEVVRHYDDISSEPAVRALQPKLEAIVGPAVERHPRKFFSQVLKDYRRS